MRTTTALAWVLCLATGAAAIYFGGPLGFGLVFVVLIAIAIGLIWALIVGGAAAAINAITRRRH